MGNEQIISALRGLLEDIAIEVECARKRSLMGSSIRHIITSLSEPVTTTPTDEESVPF
jgi:hypothetical protein